MGRTSVNYWVLAFVGDDAQQNREATRRTNVFYVSFDRTPVGRARPRDHALFYVAGQGFVAEAKISSLARKPYGETGWSSKKPPLWVISVSDVRTFPLSILYRFPGKGVHEALGFHCYCLTGGFLAIPRTGFEDVLGWAGSSRVNVAEDVRTPDASVPDAVAEEPPTRIRKAAERPRHPAVRTIMEGSLDLRQREKRAAGQHAVGKGRKRAALWTVAELGASAFGLKGVEHHARQKVWETEKTWLAGGRAEERVGVELEKLLGHGFYLFHDVPLAGLGNVDHVVLGEKGFYAVETKSHKGQVTAKGKDLLLNGHSPGKDFVKQAWRGCYRLREVLDADVTPVLLFTEAFVDGRLMVRGVRVLPLPWLVEEILDARECYGSRRVKAAVNALGAATGCYPSAAPRPA